MLFVRRELRESNAPSVRAVLEVPFVLAMVALPLNPNAAYTRWMAPRGDEN